MAISSVRRLKRSGDTYGIRYLYTGQEFDAETGDYYYDHRYYDPTTGRFKSEDWIGFPGRYVKPVSLRRQCGDDVY